MIGCLLAFATLPAGAHLFTLSNPNTALSTYTGPYGYVDISLDGLGSTATITFTATSGFLFGDGGTVAVNVNGGLGAIVAPTAANIVTDAAFKEFSTGNGNEDGFGSFTLSINDDDGYTKALGSVVFTLTKATGTWSSINDVLAPNEGESSVAAHIFVEGDGGALLTGFAADGNQLPPQSIPDGGSTIALLGFAFLGIGALRKKISRN